MSQKSGKHTFKYEVGKIKTISGEEWAEIFYNEYDENGNFVKTRVKYPRKQVGSNWWLTNISNTRTRLKEFKDNKVDVSHYTAKLKLKEQNWEQIDMARITFHLDEPTSDTEVVSETIKKYLEKKYSSIKGHYVNVVISFEESNAVYRSGEIIAESLDDLMKKISETVISNWEFEQSSYEEKHRWTIKSFSIFISLNKGGCPVEFSLRGVSKKDMNTYIFNPLFIRNNNCAIACFNYRNASFHVSDFINDCDNWKSLIFKEKKKDDLFSTDSDMPRLCHVFKKNCKVFNIFKGSFVELRSFDYGYPETIMLTLIDKHFCLIMNQNIINYKQCELCRKWHANPVEHEKKCKRCPNCYECYINEHLDERCKANIKHINTDGHQIKPKKEHKKFSSKTNILFGDTETITEDCLLDVYSVGYAKDDKDVIITEGKDALDEFIDYCLSLKEKHTMVFHNGSRFDMYFLYKRLRERDIEIKDYILSNGSYKTLYFANIFAFDLCLHLEGSLKKLCSDFGLSEGESKGDFNHKLIKTWDDVQKYSSQWKPYLIKDVESMRTIYYKYADDVWNNYHLNVDEFITLSQMTEFGWKTTIDDEVELLSFRDDQFSRRSIYGGRCYPQHQFFHSNNVENMVLGQSYDMSKINDYLVDIDVVSLYPTAMSNYEYPSGTPLISDNEKQCNILLKHWNNKNFAYKYFIAECDITPNKQLINAVLPRRNMRGGIDWNLLPIERQVYNSVDLKRAIEHGYTITKIYKCMAWKKSVNLFKKYITKCFDLKKKAEKGTAQYTVAKLMMNGLYGKMIQKPIAEKSCEISSITELNKIREFNTVLDITEIVQGRFLVKYEPFFLDETVKHPSYIGSFILGYSRLVMDKFIDAIDGYSNLNSTYYRSDTDSLIIHSSQLPKVQKYIGKNLGDIDFDIDGKIIGFIEVAPKLYICLYIDRKTGILKKHVKAKGFSKDDQEKLNWNDFEVMILDGQFEEMDSMYDETLFDSYRQKKGNIKRYQNKIKLDIVGKLKKVGFDVSSNLKEKGIEYSQIISIPFERTLNKTKWIKRIHIPYHPTVASIPLGHQRFCPNMLWKTCRSIYKTQKLDYLESINCINV